MKADVTIAKNYLSEQEMRYLERIVSFYLDYAEPLTGPGKISAEEAKLHAETQYEKYRVIQDRLYESDFDCFLMLEQEINRKDDVSFQNSAVP